MDEIKIALLSCGAEYSGVYPEIEKAINKFNAKIIHPFVETSDIDDAVEEIGMDVASPDLRLMAAKAKSLVEKNADADAVFICTCFRCAEGALMRNEVRRYIAERSNIPIISYSFTERTTAATLYTRMEALTTTARRKALLAIKKQEGLTAGIDSGSTTTKAVVMQDNEIIGHGWVPTTQVIESASKAFSLALEEAGIKQNEIEAFGATGYGRLLIGENMHPNFVQEEITVNSKGAAFLADKQEGMATVIDIGGMDNKAISMMNGIPGSFTMGGICAGASGRFLEIASRRLGVSIEELGPLALKGDYRNVEMNSYCIVFGIQSLVNMLSQGAEPADVASAACHSVSEQIFEQQLQEIDIKEPVIMVGGCSLISGLVKIMEDLLRVKIIVPKDSQYIGAVGASLLASGFRR
ncbi:MAG: methanogenesis marker 15 protein [Candidatus Methanoliparum thermophilum]|uniref:Methanogenesis marker 15 protein n=1 Tax=Methanoliparum thermophilum TaxID=2491083 RepID=A0A520KSZ0_METT2|nr:methanogenesis marker 15 protein [Candidatus Methanoliparum sp. LAM-1]RZN65022.1 MAG: methanogenesis marker 15 protein [Candidatus Methanoliparum thermophilum]BDC36091.1 methanogenesis marker 15 protein [Candidatus Methanoliparum sp. LAM-1]